MVLVMIFHQINLSTSKKMAQNVVFYVHVAPEEAFEQGHPINKKLTTQQTQN